MIATEERADTQLFLPALGIEEERQVFVDVQCLNSLAQSHIASFSDVPTIYQPGRKAETEQVR